MDHQHAVEVLAETERRADVNAIRARGFCMWPLVRLGLWERLLRGEKSPAPVPKQPLRFPPWSALMRWRESRRVRRLPRAEALFLSRHEDYGDRFAAGHYNRHADPMLAFCRRRISCVKIEAREAAAARTFPRAESTEMLEPDRLAALDDPPALEGVESLRTALAALGQPQLFDEPAVLHAIAQFFRRHDAYLEVLARVQPRIVFVVCFFDRRVLPLIAACRALGIRSVDLQHGKNGMNHGMYTHWTCVPEQGYELLPEFFWVWSDAARRNTPAGVSPTAAMHRPIVGGNRWLALWRSGPPFPPEPGEAAWLAGLRSAERVILVSLQPIDPPLPEFVREAIRRSPPTWRWLLRAHPQRRAGIAQGDCERATTAPLFSLLAISHRHITCWSSVAHEALAFGVPTLIVHPSGEQIFSEEIAAGRFQYAADADAVLAWIAGEEPAVPEGEKYIETDDALAEAALTSLLAR